MANVRLPVIQGTGSLHRDGMHRTIHPADVRGRFDVARKIVFAALIALWAALPWVKVNGAPAVFLDIEARKFFLFGFTFNAQDAWLLFFLLSGLAFGLIYLTAVAGRVWCGWACPQTVFLEGVFRRVERWVEGPREQRVRRDAGAWTTERILRKAAKHALFVVASLLVAHVILAYFVSIPRAFAMVRSSPTDHFEAFAWVVAITAVSYGNFAFFREQFCVVMCPYGRLQSVLLDDHSLVVGYDVKRGEPRGKATQEGAGDCVDCKRCVVVCPTGIDIRNGLQLDCLACTACIDACDEIMDKLDRPRGLIRYDSQDGLAGKPRKIVRPRLVLYTAMLFLGATIAAFALRSRTDVEVLLARLPGQTYVLDGETVRNAFDLHVVNKRGARETFEIGVDAPNGVTPVLPMQTISIDGLKDGHVPLFVTAARGRVASDQPVRVRVHRKGAPPGEVVVASGKFLGPTR